MNSPSFLRLIAVVMLMGLLATATGSYAQQKVYKWVDKDGTVHFSEEPPDNSLEVEVKEFTTDPAPTNVPPTRPIVKSRPVSELSLIHI